MDENTSGASTPAGAPVEVTYYTDPLCPWSWAFEPEWARFLGEAAGRLVVRYAMGGMLADWRTFRDPVHSIQNPTQMASHWYHVGRVAGVAIDGRLWHDDPPASSYPACLAVKAAGLQGPAEGASYLRRVREAAMVGRRNIARAEVLLAIADELDDLGEFDADRFRDDLIGPGAASAFQEDLREIRYREIRRFPTLALRSGDGPAIAIVGYRPSDELRAILSRVAEPVA